jgi:hypothetical protein
MFERLRTSPPAHVMEPLPGWFDRRARSVPPSADIVRALPTGPVLQQHRPPGPVVDWRPDPQESTA